MNCIDETILFELFSVIESKDDQNCIKKGTSSDSSLQSLLVDHSLTDSDQLLMEGSVQAFHMKISLGDNLAPIGKSHDIKYIKCLMNYMTILGR